MESKPRLVPITWEQASEFRKAGLDAPYPIIDPRGQYWADADEPRWIDGKHMEYETVLGLARQIHDLLAVLTGISHCESCPTCAKNAHEALVKYRMAHPTDDSQSSSGDA